MKEQFVTYEIALKLKELGFGEECLVFWFKKEQKLSIENEYYNILMCQKNKNSDFNINSNYISAPLWQQVIDWFYDKGIFIIISMDITSMWVYQVGPGFPPMEKIIPQWVTSDYVYNNPNEAREQVILKAIELCQKER